MRDLYSTHTSAGVAGSLFPAHAGDNSKLKQFKVKHGREQGKLDLGLFQQRQR